MIELDQAAAAVMLAQGEVIVSQSGMIAQLETLINVMLALYPDADFRADFEALWKQHADAMNEIVILAQPAATGTGGNEVKQ